MSAKQSKNIKAILVYFPCMILYTRFFGRVRVAHLFSFFLCCPIMWLYVLSCTVHCDLSTQTMFGSSLPPVVCRRAYVLFTLFMFASVLVVSNRYIVVFFFCFSSFYAYYVASFFEWSIFDCPAVFSNIYLHSISWWRCPLCTRSIAFVGF